MDILLFAPLTLFNLRQVFTAYYSNFEIEKGEVLLLQDPKRWTMANLGRRQARPARGPRNTSPVDSVPL